MSRVFDEELSLRFAVGDSLRTRDQLLALVTAGVIDPTVVVTSRISLEEVPAPMPVLPTSRT